MDSKKKFITAIASIACVGVIAVAGLAVGLAASSQTAKATFSIKYSAQHVAATVTAGIQDYDYSGTTPTLGTSSAIGTGATFAVTDAAGDKTLSTSSDIAMSIKHGKLFTYSFTNNASTGGHSFTVTMTDSATKTNVTVKYGTTLTGSTDADKIASLTSTSVPSAITVAAGETGYIYAYVSITSDTLDAEYTSDASNLISFAIASV